jgi:glucose-6-phosphate dehydrogenase assembly protein OpcA
LSARASEVLARVDDELRALWSSSPAPGEALKARACTMNLVVVAATPALAQEWTAIVDDVVQTVPARAIVVGLDPDGDDDLEANVSAVCTPGNDGGSVVCSERVTLVARGASCLRLASCIEPMCATDVPMTLVWLARVHAHDPTFAPLAGQAARIVLDSARGSLGSLAYVARWARERPERDRPGVADLSWTRLAPWQELCARMFDGPRLSALATHVTRVSVVQASPEGSTIAPEGALLLGWLATRLGWQAASLAGKLRLSRADGGYLQTHLNARPSREAPRGSLLSVALEASADGTTLHGEVTREGGTQSGAAAWRIRTSSGAGEQTLHGHVLLRANEPARLLERTLHRPAHDEALADAVAWADELRGEELACG